MIKNLDELTSRQRYYYLLWAKTGFNPAERRDCMDRAGYSKKRSPASVEKAIRPMIIKYMIRSGLDPRSLVLKHKEKLDCEHPAYPGMPDNISQLKALQMAYEMLNAFPSKKLEVEETREIGVSIRLETLEKAERITGEKIIDLLPKDVIIKDDQEEEFLSAQDESDEELNSPL